MNGYSKRHHAKPVMTIAQSVTNLTMLVACCTDKRLAEMTAAELAASYRVSADAAERMLAGERARREARA